MLYDTTAYYILANDTTPSLPDPTTVSGRTHALINVSSGTATWSSVGATPFTQYGVNMVNVPIPRASILLLYSDGAHWVITRTATDRRIFSAKATTAANGQATFTLAPAFAAAPVVQASVQPSAPATNGHFCEVLSVTTTAVTVQVWQGKGVLVGGQTTDPAGAGHTVHLVAMDAAAV